MSCTTYVPISTRVIQQALSELRTSGSPWRPHGATIAPNPGPIDGRWGPRTQDALLAWMTAYPQTMSASCSAHDVAPYRYELLDSPRRAQSGAGVVQAPAAAIGTISTIAAAWRARGTVAPLAPVPSTPSPTAPVFAPGVQSPPMVLPDPPPADPGGGISLPVESPGPMLASPSTPSRAGWIGAGVLGLVLLGGLIWYTQKRR